MRKRSRTNILARATAFAIIVTVGGCTVGQNYKTPATTMPAAFAGHPTTSPTTQATQITTASSEVVQWWKSLGDPELDSLVERAVTANLDVKVAASRLREARARRAIVNGGSYPEIDALGGYQHQRLSSTAQPFASVSGGGLPFEYDLWQLGFDASWEIDVFGHTRRELEAATADVQAGIEDQRDVLLSVMAEVARNYVELRGYQRELEVARENLQVQQQTLDVTRNQQANGVVTQFDVSRAAAQASATEASLPTFERQQWQAAHRIATLLGEQPNTLAGELMTAGKVPLPPGEISLGMPSDLLRRRPDIRRAERQLAAATARTGEAVADLFPRFSLTGNFGLQSSEANQLGNFDSRYFSVFPSVRWPILDFGRLRREVDVRNAEQEQAFTKYEQSILTALREVEDEMVGLQTEQRRVASLRNSVQSYQDAADVAQDLYKKGLTDFLTVLEAQRDLYEQQDALAKSEETTASEVIALYKAIGGGWEIAEPKVSDASQPRTIPKSRERNPGKAVNKAVSPATNLSNTYGEHRSES